MWVHLGTSKIDSALDLWLEKNVERKIGPHKTAEIRAGGAELIGKIHDDDRCDNCV